MSTKKKVEPFTWFRFAPSEHHHGGSDPTTWVDVRITRIPDGYVLTAKHGRTEFEPVQVDTLEEALALVAQALDAAAAYLTDTSRELLASKEAKWWGDERRYGDGMKVEADRARSHSEIIRKRFL